MEEADPEETKEGRPPLRFWNDVDPWAKDGRAAPKADGTPSPASVDGWKEGCCDESVVPLFDPMPPLTGVSLPERSGVDSAVALLPRPLLDDTNEAGLLNPFPPCLRIDTSSLVGPFDPIPPNVDRVSSSSSSVTGLRASASDSGSSSESEELSLFTPLEALSWSSSMDLSRDDEAFAEAGTNAWPL